MNSMIFGKLKLILKSSSFIFSNFSNIFFLNSFSSKKIKSVFFEGTLSTLILPFDIKSKILNIISILSLRIIL